MTRQPSEILVVPELDDAIKLFYGTVDVANYNDTKRNLLEQPVAQINARHSPASAKRVNSEDMSGLELVLFLDKGAEFMLTKIM